MVRSQTIAAFALGVCLQPQTLTEQSPRVVEIVAERYAFWPSRITVAQGTTVEFRLQSDDTNHGFRLPALGVNRIIPKRGRGEMKVVVRFPEKGKYPFFCSKPCGAGHNLMRGLVIVE